MLEDLNRTFYEVDGIQRKGVILATLSRLKQVCNHPAHFLGGIPFWQGNEEVMDAMVDVYGAASDVGLNCPIGLNIGGKAPQAGWLLPRWHG